MTSFPRRPLGPVALALALGAASAPGNAAAQGVLLDEGAFRITVGGRPGGSETFSIRRVGSGSDARILSSGRVDLERTRIDPVIVESSVETGFLRYHATVTGDAPADVTVTSGRRLEVRVVSAAGEQARELRQRPGAVLLENDVAHLYYFVGGLAEPGATLPVIVPRGSDQARLELLGVERERISVGGQTVDARRLRLALDGVERHVWVEDRETARLLRVEIPSTGYVAERVRAPL